MDNKEDFPFFVLLPLVAIGIYVLASVLALGFVENSGWVDTTGNRNFVLSRIGMQYFVAAMSIILLFLLPSFRLFKDYARLGTSWWNASIAVEAFVFIAIASNLLEGFTSVELNKEVEFLFSRTLELPIGVVLVCLVVPVAEEVVFRGGIMKPLMRNGSNPWIAILLSAIVFALMHGNLAQMIYAFLLGLVLAIIYARTKSLIVTTFCHIANNAFTAILWQVDKNYITADFDDVVGNDVMFGVMIASFIIGAWLMWIFWSRTQREKEDFQNGETTTLTTSIGQLDTVND